MRFRKILSLGLVSAILLAGCQSDIPETEVSVSEDDYSVEDTLVPFEETMSVTAPAETETVTDGSTMAAVTQLNETNETTAVQPETTVTTIVHPETAAATSDPPPEPNGARDGQTPNWADREDEFTHHMADFTVQLFKRT